MLDTIQNSVLQLLPPKRKTGQNGWISFNAPCCVYNGETQDNRNRGGIKTDTGRVSYHCFNCGYKSSYQPGRHLNYKFRKLLSWLGADDNTIRRLVIEAVRVKDIISPEDLEKEPEQEVVYEKRNLPANSKNIYDLATFYRVGDFEQVPQELYDAIHYTIRDRNIDTKKYNFFWTPETEHNLNRRIIIPYYYKGEIVGYTARTFVDMVKPKYWSSHPADFVFNLDNQQSDWKFVIVCEGAFDAMSIDGVSLSGSEISDTQAEQIDRLQREVIVVPDADKTGRKIIDRAMDLGWSVSFPVWQETCKDINEAVNKYGKLFVLKSILESKETSKLKIQLKQKKYNG
ncbi:DNA primase [uncultured Caudovirales phage]|uniref:DNA primase n=1 Tax=uncultured Caudovirales phage TaxID=2100421 RepID=A0A6J5LJQ7_9CAUD|nr:DNA primase [uncultured Caudovirales phage]